MASKYWLKLYHETLNDPKMIRLPDRLYRRAIECFLLAGELDQEGLLPSLDDIGIVLRSDPEQLEAEFVALSDVGILSLVDTNWIVTKFAERQAPISNAKRMKQYRDRKQKEQYYGDDTAELPECDETVTIRNADKDIDKEEDKENNVGLVFQTFENEIQMLSVYNQEIIKDWLDEYPEDWIIDAIHTAVEANARKPNYINGILKNWKIKGRGVKKVNQESYNAGSQPRF